MLNVIVQHAAQLFAFLTGLKFWLGNRGEVSPLEQFANQDTEPDKQARRQPPNDWSDDWSSQVTKSP